MKLYTYMPNLFVVFGCLSIVDVGVGAHGEEVETCVGPL